MPEQELSLGWSRPAIPSDTASLTALILLEPMGVAEARFRGPFVKL